MTGLIDIEKLHHYIQEIFDKCLRDMDESQSERGIIRERGFSDACGQIIEWTADHVNEGYWHSINELPRDGVFRVVTINAAGVYRVLPVIGLTSYTPGIVAWAYLPDYEG